MLKKFICLTAVTLLCMVAIAQNKGIWNGKDAAVVLTYDDALNVHLDNVLPILDSMQLKATFYLSGYSGVLGRRLPEWRQAARKGHELGNHTLFHPCIGKRPGREFVTAEYDLGDYSIKRITDEIIMTNVLLKSIDGRADRTFAYPCGDTKINDSLYLTSIHNQFVGARGTLTTMHSKPVTNIMNFGCFVINGHSADQMIQWVKDAIQAKKLIVFLFHGVGGEHGLNVSLDAHKQLLVFLKQHEKELWIAPMVDVANYLKQ